MKRAASIRPARASDKPIIATIAAVTDLFPAELLDDMIAPYLDETAPDSPKLQTENSVPETTRT